MAEDQPPFARRRDAVMTCNDLTVGAAYTKRQGAHQHSTIRQRGLGHVIEPDRIGDAWRNRQSMHVLQQSMMAAHLGVVRQAVALRRATPKSSTSRATKAGLAALTCV